MKPQFELSKPKGCGSENASMANVPNNHPGMCEVHWSTLLVILNG